MKYFENKFELIAFIVIGLILLFVSIGFMYSQSEGYNEIKEEVEVDYHSSGELFCEHYGGEYDSLFGRCKFFKKDISFYCFTSKIKERFYFYESCEVIE